MHHAPCRHAAVNTRHDPCVITCVLRIICYIPMASILLPAASAGCCGGPHAPNPVPARLFCEKRCYCDRDGSCRPGPSRGSAGGCPLQHPAPIKHWRVSKLGCPLNVVWECGSVPRLSKPLPLSLQVPCNLIVATPLCAFIVYRADRPRAIATGRSAEAATQHQVQNGEG